MAPSAPDWPSLLAPLVAGRRVVLAGLPVAGATPIVQWLRRLGSEQVLVIGSGLGTGPLPDPADAVQVVVPVRAADPVAEFRVVEQLLTRPPDEIQRALDHHDPDGEALVLVAPFLALQAVAGRPAFGARRPAWVALEDKTLADEIFDAAGVSRPPCALVPAERAPLLEAARALDRGEGTVWAGDARDGFNGGAVCVRWIQPGDVAAADEAVTFLGSRCNRVRVAPFLEGLPCSIHGMVVADGVAVFRPAEMVVLRAGPRFRYAGVSTFWDPDPGDREHLRAAARRVGTVLAERVSFRGSFGIDGVMTSDGFLPTELNPRFGGGLATVARGLADQVPVAMLHHALVEDPSLVPARTLEDRLTDAADAHRAGGGWLPTRRRFEATHELPIVREGRGWRRAGSEDAPDATVSVGPGAAGGAVRVQLAPERTAIGPPVGALVAAAFGVADERFGTEIGPLQAAPHVR